MHLNYVQLGSLGVKQQGKERKLFQMLIAYVLNNHDHESLYNGYLKTFTILHVPSEVDKCFNPFTPKISFVTLISFCLIIYDVSLENWNGSTNNPYCIFFSILFTRLLDIELIV